MRQYHVTKESLALCAGKTLNLPSNDVPPAVTSKTLTNSQRTAPEQTAGTGIAKPATPQPSNVAGGKTSLFGHGTVQLHGTPSGSNSLHAALDNSPTPCGDEARR